MKNLQLDHNSHRITGIKYPLCLLAHDLSSPENIGSLFRIADALGLEKIWLSGSSPVPPNPKIKKASRSTEKHVSFEYHDNPLKIINALIKKGYKIISLEITSSSIDIRDLTIYADEKACLIIGSEKEGIEQRLLNLSDNTIHIPMMGKNSSMNVATAAAIACWEILRKK